MMMTRMMMMMSWFVWSNLHDVPSLLYSVLQAKLQALDSEQCQRISCCETNVAKVKGQTLVLTTTTLPPMNHHSRCLK